MTEKTVDVLVDGKVVYNDVFYKDAATSVSEIRFYDDHNCASYIIDNLTVVSDATAAQKTITLDSADDITATYGRSVTLPTLENTDSSSYLGWADEDDNLVPNTFIVTEDMSLTAKYRNALNITEDFSKATLDATKPSLVSNSGLTYDLGVDVVTEGTDVSSAYSVSGDELIATKKDGYYNMNTVATLPTVNAGKVYIKFKHRIPDLSYGNHNHQVKFFAIKDADGNDVAQLWLDKTVNGGSYTSYVETDGNGNFTKDNSTIATIGGSAGDAYGKGVAVTYEYIIDLATKTYTISVDGAAAKTYNFATDATNVASLNFLGGNNTSHHYDLSYAVSGIEIMEDIIGDGVTVTYMNGSEEYATSTISFGIIDSLPASPAKAGKAFCGWATTEDGEALTETEIAAFTTDTVLYATFRDVLNITEDFGDNFSIDYSAKTMTSNSGLTFSTTKETSFDTTNGLKVGTSGLNVALNSGALVDSDVMIKFPSIAAGKVYIAFDLLNNHTSAGHSADKTAFFNIGNSEATDWALTLSTVSSSEGAPLTQFKTEDGSILSEGKIEYVIDFDNNTYVIKSGGVQVGTTHTLADTSKIDAIYLTTCGGGWYSLPFAIDNLVIKEDPTGEGAKVTYMNGNAEYATATVNFGIIDAAPAAPSVDGKAFLGWATADGKIIDADYYSTVVSDTVLYATFRNHLNLVEDFEDGFTLVPSVLETKTDENGKTEYTGNVTTAGSITTDSGFKFSSKTANAYGALSVADANGSKTLYNNGYTGVNAYLSDIYMDFPAIYSGKVYIAFDLRIPNYGLSNSAFNNQVFFGIGNEADGYAVKLNKAYNEEIVSVDGTDTSVKTTKVTTEAGTQVALQPTSEYYTYEYVIDLDNNTYSLEVSGTNGDAITLTDIALGAELDYIDRIALPQSGNQNTWYNTPWYIDNVTLVENYTGTVTPPVVDPDPVTYTVTFYDEDGTSVLGTATVNEGETAVYTGTTPTKAATAQYTYTFAGWDGSLENITANTSVKATYTSTVNKYKVTFVDHDGTPIKEEDVEYGASATAPSDPTREGYTFTGWDGVYTNITGAVTVTATYKENAAEELVATAYWETDIEPMTAAEYKAIMGEDMPDGYYAWKLKHSLTGLGTLNREGSKLTGYTGRMIAKAQVNVVFGDAVNDVYAYAEPIASESTLDAGSNYGLNQTYKQFATFWDGAFDAAASYPNTNTTVEGSVENAFVTFLVTKTDTFDITISGVMQIAEFVADDGTNGGVGTIETYESDKDVCADMIAKGEENYYLFGTNPTTISVVDGVVPGGSEDDDEGVTFLYGDIDGDGTVSSADGIAIINSTYGGTKVYGDFEIGKEVVSGVIYGDVDCDGTVSSADGIAIINSTYGGTKVYGDFEIGKNATVK